VNLFNNTVISNDSTASSGVLFQSLFAPLASAPGKNCFTGNGLVGSGSCPQPAGLVSDINSPVLQANLPASGGIFGFSCPYAGLNGGGTSCRYFSNAVLDNNIFWHNRSMFISLTAPNPGPTNQQNTVTLFNANFVGGGVGAGTAVASQPSADALTANGSGFIVTGGTGACVPPANQTLANATNYWDIGVRGDTSPTNHVLITSVLPNVTLRHTPNYSVVTNLAAYTGAGGTGNVSTDPTVLQQYCNGSRVPPEAGLDALWGVPPGTIETNGLPHPVFNLAPAATVDEGNNWINLRWGPLALTNLATAGGAYGDFGGGAPLGNYGIPASGSSALNKVPTNAVGGAYALAPLLDFYGHQRKTLASPAVDAGAVEH
jgi:hypothetical protein